MKSLPISSNCAAARTSCAEVIVVDSNILIRAVLGRRVRQIFEEYAGRGVRFYAPCVAFADAEKYLPALMEKRGLPTQDLVDALNYLKTLVGPIDHEMLSEFEEDARMRLRGRDEDDWPILAASLALACPIWSEDTDFFGTGVAVWTSNRIEIFLKAHAKSPSPESE